MTLLLRPRATEFSIYVTKADFNRPKTKVQMTMFQELVSIVMLLGRESGRMVRKLPSSYVRKLNEEQKKRKSIEAKQMFRKQQEQRDPDSGRLKGFTMVCQTCGTNSKFTVDKLGYATCSHCRAVASFRFGNVA